MRIRWFLLTLVGLVCVLLISSQVVLPGLFGDYILEELVPVIDDSGSVQLQVSAYPALKMFAGKMDYLKVDGENINLGNIPTSHVFLEVRGLNFDTKELISNKTLKVKDLKEGNMTALITEEGLNSYFRSVNRTFDDFVIILGPDNIPRIKSDVEILGMKLNIIVEGRFIVENGTKIKFIPNKFIVENTQVPSLLLSQLVNEWDLCLDIGKLPFPLYVKEVRVEDGNILIISQIG